MAQTPIPSDHVEVEWQFDALDLRPVQRWLEEAGPKRPGLTLVAGPGRRHVDVYLDTDDWRLYRAGFSLRIRKGRGSAEATLKALENNGQELRRRREITESLPTSDPEAIVEAPGPVGGRVRAAAGRRPLVPIVEVRTLRRPYLVSRGDRSVAEIVLDQSTVPMSPGQAPARLRRVELEVLSAGLTPVGTPDLGPVEITEDISIGEVGFVALRRHLAAMITHEPGTRIGDDPEELHDMRVAVRRLRAATTVFADVLPVRAQSLRAQLTWVADALGAVRDLDVQLEQLGEWKEESGPEDRSALAALDDLLRTERESARRTMMTVLDSARFDRLVRGMETFVRRGPSRRNPMARAPALQAAPDLLRKPYRKARKAGRRLGDDSTAAAYHRLRIRCKRLRYAVEFVADLYPKEAPPVARRLTRLQDLLGLHQDAHVAIARLRVAATQHQPPLTAPTVFAMGRVAERYDARAARLRRRFPKRYDRAFGGTWKRFQRAMKQRRPPAPAGEVPRAVRQEAP